MDELQKQGTGLDSVMGRSSSPGLLWHLQARRPLCFAAQSLVCDEDSWGAPVAKRALLGLCRGLRPPEDCSSTRPVVELLCGSLRVEACRPYLAAGRGVPLSRTPGPLVCNRAR